MEARRAILELALFRPKPMTLLDDAVARYHKALESPALADLAWAKSIQEKMAANNLLPNGRPVCPVWRPHFLSRRQYEAMVKAAETLYSAIDRVRDMALATPALMNRLEMLPAEKMLATVDPGYPHLAVTSMLDTQLVNGSFRFLEAETAAPTGVAYIEALNEVFYDAPPMKELRKKYKITKAPGGMKRLMNSMLTAYKVSGGKKFPRIAIIEFRPPFKDAPTPEHLLMAEHFRRYGYPTEVVTPDQLEYRNGLLCRGDFGIEIALRRVSAQEFLFRFDLTHPLVRAYREGKVCMVNSFRTEMVQKKAILSLLTDETVTAKFPAAERKAITEHIPWTRLVTAGKTNHGRRTVDLQEFILHHREKLVLKPNDPTAELHSIRGWETEPPAWERALKTALLNPYVVQERVEVVRAAFPVYQFGKMELRQMEVEVHPHIHLGKVDGCSAQVADAASTFSTLSGQAPVFLIESA